VKRGEFWWRCNCGLVTKLFDGDVQLTKIWINLRLRNFGLLIGVIYTSNET